MSPQIEKAIREKVASLAQKINKTISEGRQISPNAKIVKEYEMQKRLLGIVIEDKKRKKLKSIPLRAVHEGEKEDKKKDVKKDKKDKIKEARNKAVMERLNRIELKKTYMPPLKESRIVKFYSLLSLLTEGATDDVDLKQRLMTLRQLIDDPRVDQATKLQARKQYAQLQVNRSPALGAQQPTAVNPKLKPMGA